MLEALIDAALMSSDESGGFESEDYKFLDELSKEILGEYDEQFASDLYEE